VKALHGADGKLEAVTLAGADKRNGATNAMRSCRSSD
jgi:hypothetical protein